MRRLGRLNTFVGGLVLGSAFGCLQTLPAPFMSFELYATLEFLIAFAASGVLGASCAFNMEWVVAKRRTYLNCMALLLDGVHPVFIGLAAWYFEHSFVAYRISLAASGAVMILVYFVFSESPQWLLARQKYTTLIKSISNAGRINGRPPSTKLIEHIQSQRLHTIEQVDIDEPSDHGNQVTIRDLFKHKVLVVRLSALSMVWLSITFAYYGIIFSSTQVHDNKYLSYALVGLAEVPGALLPMAVLDRIGRRMTIGISLLAYGAALITTTQLPAELSVVQLILCSVCRGAVKVATIGLCTYVAELWPTAVRNRAFNICSLFGRFGGILATVVVLLAKFHANLPLFIYGSSTIVGARFCCSPFCPKPCSAPKHRTQLTRRWLSGERINVKRRNRLICHICCTLRIYGKH